ncbi:hypothetical protein [Microvirga sp. CF3016]|uniref:hypothetical protein n=1 Tax=Microvirga sp. CF3016 TaxID=3110181 RepID=UPI002E75F4C7|nr:hypothetical protein [Microvirga sp. CF3016]MEE1611889.1 hypothetical protein [Microvirga sp. CF3016]
MLLLFPDKNSSQDWGFYDWPEKAHELIKNLLRHGDNERGDSKCATVSLEWKNGSKITGHLRDPFEYPVPVNKVNDFWHRALGGSTKAAEDMLNAWAYRGVSGAVRPRRAALPLPIAEAGLLLPLERARTALGGIAPENSLLRTRNAMRPSASSLSAIGRPWLGQPDALVRFASADPTVLDDGPRQILFGPPDVGEWLHDREMGLDLKNHPYSADLRPDDIARSALGHDGEDLLWLFDRMHAFHYAALNGIRRAADTPARADDKDSPAADRRLQQLWSSPGLMRLFGFARDVYIDLEQPFGDGLGRFTQIDFPDHRESEKYRIQKTAFDLNKSSGLFYPPSKAAYKHGNDPLFRYGVRRLGGKKDDGSFRYSMISIEPVASADEDIQASANGRKARATTGPLALVRCNPESENHVRDEDTEYAEDLSAPAPDRLDIGIDTEDGGIHWHSASPRTIRHGDPKQRGKADESWPQKVIDALTPNWLPAWERDSHGLVSATFRQKNESAGLQSVECFDPRVATYSGEAIGARSNSIDVAGRMPRWGARPVVLDSDQDLIIDQHIGVSTEPRAALALRRLGWRYHFGIRRAYLGGAGPTLERARIVYEEDPEAPYPPAATGGGGFRYLRHDAIAKPIVMLAPDVPRPPAAHAQLQTGSQMVLISRKSSAGGAAISRTTRILVAPSVEPEFAAMHEVFDELAEPSAADGEVLVAMPDPDRKQRMQPLAIHAPRQGLPNAWLNYEDPPPGHDVRGQHRFRLGAGEKRPTPYYPDPAACYMVLRLLHPERPDTWLSPPLVVRIRGDAAGEKSFRWPDLLPVRVDLRAANGAKDEGLQLSGGKIISEGGLLFRRVTVSLRPGESAVLKTWLAPSADDLLAWFDVVERSAQLCESEGQACECPPGLACATGRQSLLGDTSGPLGSDEDEHRRLATLYHQRLLEEPNYLFADVADINIVHVTDVPWAAAKFISTPIVARPLTLEKDALTAYLATAGSAADWGASKAEDGATAVILGGTIEFDQATTSGLVVEASMVRPGDQVLEPAPLAVPPQFVPNEVKKIDAPNGVLNFGHKVWSEVLRIQSIPLPADGRSGPRRYQLEELLLGRIADMQQAAIQYGAPLQHGQARQATFRVVPVARHTSMISRKPIPIPEQFLNEASAPVWIPATIRPAAPDVKELVPVFHWDDSSTVHQAAGRFSRTRKTGLRLVLRRPWFSTGEGERVGVVFWPPPVLNLPLIKNQPPFNEIEVPQAAALSLLTEEDLDPFGRFVSVWGSDPIKREPQQTIDRHRFLSWNDLRLPEEAMMHPRVLMPIPGAIPGQNKEIFVEVSVVSFPLTFIDHERDAYVDIDLTPVKGVAEAVVRLGVVRMQLNARQDTPPSQRIDRSGIRCSPPIPVQSQLLPERKLSVSVTEVNSKQGADGDQMSVSVVLSGPASPIVAEVPDTRVCIELSERISGEEIAVRTVGGGQARAEGSGNSNDLYLKYDGGEANWVANFLLPGKLGTRNLVASAREEALMEFANEDEKSVDLPRYFGKIELNNPKIGQRLTALDTELAERS